MKETAAIPLVIKGKDLFRKNCKMCHLIELQMIGPALKCMIKQKGEHQFLKAVRGENGHKASNLAEKEIRALIEFLTKECN